MARARRGELVGRAVWALAPYAPATPFRLYPGPGDRPPITVAYVAQLRRAAQHSGDAEFTTLTSAKIRPVLVIAEAGDSFDGPAALALRLRRFSKLNPTSSARCEKVERRDCFTCPPTDSQDCPRRTRGC